jgi:hypothetical protein
MTFANNANPEMAVQCCANTFVVIQTLALFIKIGGEDRHLHKPQKRF